MPTFAKIFRDMFAIVNIAGKQTKVKSGDTVVVQKVHGEVGDNISLDEVLLTSNDGNVTFNSGSVEAEIVEHFKGDKVITFHKKRRKGYKKTIGHRDHLTKLKVNSIK